MVQNLIVNQFSDTPCNLILYPNLSALTLISRHIYKLYSLNMNFIIKKGLKHKDGNILSFDATSSPFMSEDGFASAYPRSCAFLKPFEKTVYLYTLMLKYSCWFHLRHLALLIFY